MNPLSLIKEGIKGMDWNKVVRGYNTMTGDDLSISMPNDEDITLLGIRAIIADELSKREVVIAPAVFTNQDETSTCQDEDQNHFDFDDANDAKDRLVGADGEFTGELITSDEDDSVGHYGNSVRHITGEADATMIKRNERKAARTQAIKVQRPAHTLFDVACNQCKKTFKSNRRSSEIGEKCPKCLGGMKG